MNIMYRDVNNCHIKNSGGFHIPPLKTRPIYGIIPSRYDVDIRYNVIDKQINRQIEQVHNLHRNDKMVI